MYALLAEHSILGRLKAPGSDDPAFSRGVRHSLRERAALTHDLFSARTLAVLKALMVVAVCAPPFALLWASLRTHGKLTIWDRLSGTMVRYRTPRTTAI